MLFLYATEFFSGMSVMAAELGASRFLAPYFSSSQIVWTVIIGMIMIAMSIGNLMGGKMADKALDPSRLYFFLGISGVWLSAIPVLGKYVIAFSALIAGFFFSKAFLVFATWLSCVLLFVPPLLLMGMTTPCLVKFAVSDLKDTGKITGKLSAIQTIGSIIGTFVPTFFTIPSFGTKLTFVIFAFILGTISAIFFFKKGEHKIRAVIFLVTIIACGIMSKNISYSFSKTQTVYEDESIYNYLRVDETDNSVILSTHIFFGVQSIWKKHEEFTGMYYDIALAAPYMSENFKSALILGNGTGTYASLLQKHFPYAKIDGVEIDEKIAGLSKKYFAMPEKINVMIRDGRAALKSLGKYDVIMVDTYRDITIPFELSTVEFFREVKTHLNDGGVVVMNMNMRGEINEHLTDTINSVFEYCYIAESVGNIEVFATDFSKAKERLKKSSEAFPYLKKISLSVPKTGEKILTDDCAPVELLGMEALHDIVQTELEGLKGKNLTELFK